MSFELGMGNSITLHKGSKELLRVEGKTVYIKIVQAISTLKKPSEL